MSRLALGPFELMRPIASGGMGEVWYGAHVREAYPVAAKVLTGQFARDPHFVTLFRTEVRAVAWLDHPGIILVLDHGEIGEEAAEASEGRLVAGSPYLVMEHLGGGHLGEMDVPLPWPKLRTVLVDLLDALAHAHAHRVLHRDLKPGNVLFAGPDDLRPGVRLTDFGIAHPADGTQFEDAVAGTPQYIAPEQVRVAWREYGPWTDLYAFGCLVWRVVCGMPPYPFKGDEALKAHVTHELPDLEPRTEVPAGFDDWIRALLVKDPRKRTRRAADAKRALLALDGQAPARFPVSWRSNVPPLAAHSLGGAGLGLFGLRRIPVVGRDEQRDALWDALRRVDERGSAEVMMLHGPTGAGKTRLLEWLVGRAHETGVAEIVGVSCGPVDGPTDAIRRMLELELRRPPTEYMALTTAAERYEAVARLIDRIARSRTVLLSIDDAQWGQDLIELVHYLLGRQSRRQTAVLCLLAVQDEALANRPWASRRLDDLVPPDKRIGLGPLSTHHRTELLRGMLGLEETLAASVEARSGGNPQFAVELVGAWVRRNMLVPSEKGFVLRDNADRLLPDDLHQVWKARIRDVLEGLPSSGRHYLELAAALGIEVNDIEWRRLCKDKHVRLRLLERLYDQRLALRTHMGWAFVHGMLRESIIRIATEAGRWPAHNIACATMLKRFGESGDPIRLGQHLYEAGDHEGALDALLTGLEDSANVAVRVLLSLLGRCETIMRDMHLPRSDRRWGQVWLRRAQIYMAQGQMSDGREWAERAEDAARANEWPRLLVQSLLVQAQAARRAHDLQDTERLLEQIRQVANEEADIAEARHLQASLHAARSELKQARARNREAREIYNRLGQPIKAAMCLRTQALFEMRQGNWELADQLLRAALPIYESGHGSRKGLGDCMNAMAEIARHNGDLEEAERGYRESIRLYEAMGLGVAVIPRLNLGMICIHRKQFEEGRRALEVARRVLEERDDRPFLAGAWVGLLVCAAGLGDWETFDKSLAKSEWLLHATGFADPDVGLCAEMAGDLANEAGESSRAHQAWGMAIGQWGLLRDGERVAAIERRMGR